MTDRELLELAAKAAGLKFVCWESGRNKFILTADYPSFCASRWNPLTDDSDALRLAVKLGLSCERDFDRIDVYSARELLSTEFLYALPTPTDPLAATRRAIVRAAAAIGAAMP